MNRLIANNKRLLPSDEDLMQLSIHDIRTLQSQLKHEQSKLIAVSQYFYY